MGLSVGAVLIIATWMAGTPSSQQVVTIEVSSMKICESMAKQAKEKMDVSGRYVGAVCLEVKE